MNDPAWMAGTSPAMAGVPGERVDRQSDTF